MSIPFIQLAKNDPRWLQDEPQQFRWGLWGGVAELYC
jgi:hypothetical protein